ncbi:MAG: flippase activity-associated protein Agl23 [Acidobacteriota bacterium]
MTRRGVGGIVMLALAVGLVLRFTQLDARPMHHDEANQAVKFATLLETGVYRYDPLDHHGPTLYYFSLPAAWLRGQSTFAALDERTLRAVPAVFGAAMILLLPGFLRGLDRTAVATGAWLLAVSPAMVFYSRMFIQESLFACFTLAFVIAAGRVTTSGGYVWSALAGLAAGLALATKETSVIVIPAAVAGCGIASWSRGPTSTDTRARGGRASEIMVSIAVALLVAALFYSSFFAAPGDVIAPFRAASTYLSRAVAPADHVEPWHYYLGLLAYSSSGGLRWSEGAVLALALIGAAAAWRPPGQLTPERVFWARYLAIYVVIATAIFSIIPYKTPWNVLPFYAGVLVLAGTGCSALVQGTASRVRRAALTALFAIVCGHLGWQAWRASVTYASDSRNPYVYAQTLPDTVRMALRIRALAAAHQDGARTQVSVIASPYEQWPLPWYLRMLPNVGYWTSPGDPVALRAPVIVCSMDQAEYVDSALGDRYVSEFYGLRPGVLLALYVDRNLWNRFISEAASGTIWRERVVHHPIRVPRPEVAARRARHER